MTKHDYETIQLLRETLKMTVDLLDKMQDDECRIPMRTMFMMFHDGLERAKSVLEQTQ